MNAAEFKKLMIPCSNKLYHFARVILRDENEAKDAVQETFLKLWKMKDELGEIRNHEAFAMRIIKNWCLDQLKAKKPELREILPEGRRSQESGRSPQEVLEVSDSMEKFRFYLQKLPEQQRVIVQLRDIQGYNYDEIAEITGMNKTSIRVNLSRARGKIREYLNKINEYGTKETG